MRRSKTAVHGAHGTPRGNEGGEFVVSLSPRDVSKHDTCGNGIALRVACHYLLFKTGTRRQEWPPPTPITFQERR